MALHRPHRETASPLSRPLHRVALLGFALVLTSATSGPRLASAQPGGVYFDGLLHEPLGSATVEVVPDPVGTGRRVRVYNIGSSGQDGVGITSAPGGRGYSFLWDTASDLGTTGSSHTVNMRVRLNALEERLVTIGLLNATASTQEVDVDFSDLSPTSGWMVLTDETGAVVHRAPITAQASLTVTGTTASPRPAYLNFTCTFAREARYVLRYTAPVTVQSVLCTSVHLVYHTGPAMEGPASVELMSSVPSGAGEVVIEQEGIVPPCAGCPNGPEELGDAVALGDARWGGGGGGGAGGVLFLENLGSSGQDGVRVVGEPVCCRNRELGITISDHAQSSSDPGVVTIDSHGTVGGVVQSLGTLTCTVVDDEWAYVPDFSALGASGYRVALYRDGAHVATEDNPPDGARKWGDGHVTLMKAYDDGSEEYRIICITHPCPGSPVTMNGTEYLADEIRMTPLSGAGSPPLPSVENVASMTVVTTSTSSLTIAGTSFRSTAPVVGVEGGTPIAETGTAWLAPNPTSGFARIVFALPVAARTRVSVHDVAGREVRALADRTLAAGAHDLSWDGLDDSGRPTRAGLYFVKIDSGARRQVARVTRLD